MMQIEFIESKSRDINLFSDNQAALKALDSCVDNSKTIMQYRRSLNEMVQHYKITPIWVAGYQHIEGNCIADELTKKQTTIKILQEKNTIGIATFRLFIKQKDGRMYPNVRNLQTDMVTI